MSTGSKSLVIGGCNTERSEEGPDEDGKDHGSNTSGWSRAVDQGEVKLTVGSMQRRHLKIITIVKPFFRYLSTSLCNTAPLGDHLAQ